MMCRLSVQLSPGSGKGQNATKERASAPREWDEGRWVSNQTLLAAGYFQYGTPFGRLEPRLVFWAGPRCSKQVVGICTP